MTLMRMLSTIRQKTYSDNNASTDSLVIDMENNNDTLKLRMIELVRFNFRRYISKLNITVTTVVYVAIHVNSVIVFMIIPFLLL